MGQIMIIKHRRIFIAPQFLLNALPFNYFVLRLINQAIERKMH